MKHYYVIFIAILTFLLVSLSTETLRAAHSSSHSGGKSAHISVSASAHARSGSLGRGWGGWVWSPAWNWGNPSYYSWGRGGYGYGGNSNEIMKTPGVHPWRLSNAKFGLQRNAMQHYFPEEVKDHPPVPPNTYSDE
ncbi:MAG: hypothetical protein E6Q59_07360 [Nitrosomonas sp.]|nr:MAG: hypothetical protein E6Q59_07360 [Nitrosomonas sp.]